MSDRKDKERILIVDDDEGTCKSLSLILGRKGYETDTAGTGGEALEKAKEKPFNLVLLDIRLADADGLEMITPLKELNPDLEIVMATGYASVENAVQALNKRAAAYLTKPLNMDEVLATIVNILEKQLLVRDKRKAEEALRESEERHRQLVENLNDVIYAVSADGEMTYISPVIESVIGYSAEEVKGRSFAEYILPEDLNVAMESHLMTLSGSATAGDFRITNKSGEVRWVHTSNRPIFDGERVVGTTGVLTDITERKQAELALIKSEKYFREITENSSDIIIITDKDGTIIYCSPSIERFAGYKPEEIIDRSSFEFIHPDDVQRAIVDFGKSILSKDMAIPNAFRILHKDGSVRYFAGLGKNLLDHPSVAGFIMNIRDDTERKLAELRIEHLNAVLRAIRNVNQLIIREGDRTRLLKGICDNLTETRGYYSCWAALLDDSGALVTCTESGLGADFKPVAEQLKEGWLPQCASQALEKTEIVLVEDVKDVCGGCPLAQKYLDRGAMVFRLEHGGRVYGLLEVSVPGHVTVDEEELSLLREVTGDISFALYGIEQRERRERAEEELRRSEENYRSVFEGTIDGMVVIDAETMRVVLANEAAFRMYGFDPGTDISRIDPLEHVHPDDRERASSAIAEDMFVKNLGETVEFRTLTRDGGVKWVSGRGTIIEYQGRSAGLVSFRDVTAQKRAEEALKESEERYRDLVEREKDVIFSVDTVGNITSINAAARSWGYEPEDLIGKNFLELIPEEWREKTAVELQNLLLEAGELTAETMVIDKNGELHTIEYSATVIQEGGEYAGVHGIVRDITERKLAELTLIESEERYRRLVESNPHGIQVVDTEGVITFTNPAYQKMLSYTEKELLGESMLNLLEPIAKRDELRNYLHYLVKEQPSPATYHQQNRTKDGRIIDVAVDWNYKRDEQGHVTGFTSVITDITEQKRAQEALRESEERYKILFERTLEPIFVLDAETMRVVICNEACRQVAGFASIEEMIGKNPLDFVHPDDRERALKIIVEDMFERNLRGFNEFRMVSRHGEEKWVIATGTLIDFQGRPSGLISFIDITERKWAEDALRENEERWQSLVTNAPDIIINVDRELHILFLNRTVEGFKVEDVIGKSICDFTSPEYHDVIKASINKVFGTGKTATYETMGSGAGGKPTWYSTRVGPIRSGTQVVSVLLISNDVTERKLAEEEVKRYAQREATLLQIAQAVSQTTDMDRILNSALAKTCEAFDVPAGGIYLLDWVEWRLILRAHYGVSEEYVNDIVDLALGKDEVQRGFKLKEPVVEADKMFSKGNADKVALAMKKEGLKSSVNIVFRSKGLPVGEMMLADRRKRRFREDEFELLQAIADEIAIGIENVQLLELSRERAVTDEMTGLYNRRHFFDVLEAEMARTIRYKYPFTLVMLDLDGFKEYNDKYGHINGDAVLKSLAQTLKSTLRKSDTSFRYGGDEFAIILADTDAERSKKVIERVRKRWLHTPKALYPILETPIGFSAGIAQFPEHADTADGLVFIADNALYHAKSKGGYRTVLASDMESISPEILEVATPDHVLALASTVDAKDPYTYGHSRNVANIAQSLGKAIGMSGKELTDLCTASLLHDIGKLGVPDAILTKPGKLTEEEWEVMKRHSADGERIVSYVKDLSPLVHMIRHHHEWYDGSGYPDGLKGETIPLGARIISIADAYDTMLGRRPYREPVSPEEALEELSRSSGTQFDPKLVEAFIGFSREHK